MGATSTACRLFHDRLSDRVTDLSSAMSVAVSEAAPWSWSNGSSLCQIVFLGIDCRASKWNFSLAPPPPHLFSRCDWAGKWQQGNAYWRRGREWEGGSDWRASEAFALTTPTHFLLSYNSTYLIMYIAGSWSRPVYTAQGPKWMLSHCNLWCKTKSFAMHSYPCN